MYDCTVKIIWLASNNNQDYIASPSTVPYIKLVINLTDLNKDP